MIALLLLSFAAVCKAIADSLQHHFDTSIFSKLDARWWNPAVSYKYVGFLPLTKYRLDGWHLANSLMIVAMVCAVVFHRPVLAWYYEIAAGGAAWNLVFNLFYNKILKK